MSAFTETEIAYLRGQRLGRLATVGTGGSPHVVPVGFHLDDEGQTIEIGGHGLSRSKKWRDLRSNPRVAFVVDDLVSVRPWTVRGMEVRGRAELNEEAATNVSAAEAGITFGSASCPNESSVGGSRVRRSRRLDGALVRSACNEVWLSREP